VKVLEIFVSAVILLAALALVFISGWRLTGMAMTGKAPTEDVLAPEAKPGPEPIKRGTATHDGNGDPWTHDSNGNQIAEPAPGKSRNVMYYGWPYGR
jgi:hypothetical protein